MIEAVIIPAGIKREILASDTARPEARISGTCTARGVNPGYGGCKKGVFL